MSDVEMTAKITLNATNLQEMQQALEKLSNFPDEAPSGFDVTYVELEGKAGEQPVIAQYESGEWNLIITAESSSDSDDDDEQQDQQDQREGEQQDEEAKQYSSI